MVLLKMVLRVLILLSDFEIFVERQQYQASELYQSRSIC